MSREPPLDHTANCLKAFDDGHAHIKLDQINEGFANMKAGRVVRSVIDFGVVKVQP